MSYTRIQAIREGAGLLMRVNGAKPRGLIDGTNKVFVVDRRPIVDSNNDDAVNESDVVFYVDSLPVTVVTLDQTAGSITLETAPTVGQVLTVDYCFSPLNDEYVIGKQQEADNWINSKIRPYKKIPVEPTPGILASAAELYSAGLILTRDWGARADTQQTSKDGFAKIKLARELLEDYIQGLKDSNETTQNDNGDKNVATSMSDVDVFDRAYQEDCGIATTLDDDAFMRRK